MGGAQVRLELAEVGEGDLRVTTHLDDAVVRYPEQERKARPLVRPASPRTYREFVASGPDAVATAKFAEPGFNTNADPMRFDLSWRARPARALWRQTRNPAVPGEIHEVEIRFENAHRLLVADASLATLLPHAERPTAEDSLLRLTFGIGTPEVYGDIQSRATEFANDRPAWLLLVDAEGRAVDNHLGGLDRVHLRREVGDPGLLHVLLVGYERIAVVGHLTVPWSA